MVTFKAEKLAPVWQLTEDTAPTPSVIHCRSLLRSGVVLLDSSIVHATTARQAMREDADQPLQGTRHVAMELRRLL